MVIGGHLPLLTELKNPLNLMQTAGQLWLSYFCLVPGGQSWVDDTITQKHVTCQPDVIEYNGVVVCKVCCQSTDHVTVSWNISGQLSTKCLSLAVGCCVSLYFTMCCLNHHRGMLPQKITNPTHKHWSFISHKLAQQSHGLSGFPLLFGYSPCPQIPCICSVLSK